MRLRKLLPAAVYLFLSTLLLRMSPVRLSDIENLIEIPIFPPSSSAGSISATRHKAEKTFYFIIILLSQCRLTGLAVRLVPTARNVVAEHFVLRFEVLALEHVMNFAVLHCSTRTE